MKVVGVIPARYASTRFPGKALASLAGKPLIQHVYERAKRVGFNQLFVATDDNRIRDAVKGFNGEVVMTSPHHPSGTDRVAEVIQMGVMEFTPTVVVNIQGDEPLLSPPAVRSLISIMEKIPTLSMATLITDLKKGELDNPSIVKVLLNPDDYILSFSRTTNHQPPNPSSKLSIISQTEERGIQITNQPSPLYSPNLQPVKYYKHIGIYAYSNNTVLSFTKLPQTVSEKKEGLEQLRAMENGIRIKGVYTSHSSIPVDFPEDLKKVENIINNVRRKNTFEYSKIHREY
jgi:3-deoxy-manno-octulosonate cytidylyltransferase (CMP-KDO synthetase)